ncbi:MAG: RES domain-containing protein [Flavobacterium sp.]|nr:MAG: RES domain-containing protein [Flavobacterium sp.]
MIVYRISKARHSRDLSGEGARLNGGRWNHILTPCVYTSSSRALAVLEFTVNVNIDDIPGNLRITVIEIPDDSWTEPKLAKLPADWMQAPSPSSTKDFGTKLLKMADAAVLKFPSAVIPQEFNYILNPRHPETRDFKILDVEELVFDSRIKAK